MIRHKINLLIELITTAYDKFNKELFNSELPDAVITIKYINPPKKKHYLVYGETSANGSFIDTDGNRAESITISPVAVNMGFEEVMLTLIHEMVHIYNKMLQVEDVTKGGKHKKAFKESAEAFGLSVEKDDVVGWTTPYLSAEHYSILSGIEYDKSIFNLDYELKALDKDKDKEKKPKKTKYKHFCPNGHNKPFKLSEPQTTLTCSICGASFTIEEELPKDE